MFCPPASTPPAIPSGDACSLTIAMVRIDSFSGTGSRSGEPVAFVQSRERARGGKRRIGGGARALYGEADLARGNFFRRCNSYCGAALLRPSGSEGVPIVPVNRLGSHERPLLRCVNGFRERA